jgi:hypothetical protein
MQAENSVYDKGKEGCGGKLWCSKRTICKYGFIINDVIL